jgi:tetratricopeptide (TPR) repeat protein
MRPIEPDWDDSRILYEKGWDAMHAGQLEAAIQLFEQSNRVDPHYKTCLHLGECLLRLRRHKDAIIPLAAATALNRQGIAPFMLAEVYMTLGEPGKAHEFVTLAIERQPDLKRARELEPSIREAAERRIRDICEDP